MTLVLARRSGKRGVKTLILLLQKEVQLIFTGCSCSVIR